MLPENTVLTLDEVAAFLRIGKRTAYDMACKGLIPGKKIGQQWRFDRSEILEWFASRTNTWDLGRKTVLVVEDEVVIQENLSSLLREILGKEFSVVSCGTGLDAFMLIGRQKPCAVVLDVMLPDIDGNVICRELKENKNTRDILIIAVSGYSDVGREIRKNGADIFLAKPLRAEAVANKILLHLRKSDIHRS